MEWKNAPHALRLSTSPKQILPHTNTPLKNPRWERTAPKNPFFCQIITENVSTKAKRCKNPTPKDVSSEIPLQITDYPFWQSLLLPELELGQGLTPLSVLSDVYGRGGALLFSHPLWSQRSGRRVRPPPWPLLDGTERWCPAVDVLSFPILDQMRAALPSRCGVFASGRLTQLQRCFLCPPPLSLHIYICCGVDVLPPHTTTPFLLFSSYLLQNIESNHSLVFDLLMASTSKNKGKEPMGDESFIPQPNAPLKGPSQGTSGEIPPMRNPIADGAGGSKTKKAKKVKAPKVDMQKLKEIQSTIQQNIQAMNTCSLFATIIGDPVEAKDVRKRIRSEWKFLEGGFQLVPVANKWFELRFDHSTDRDKVWSRRPFHIASQLLLVRPWSSTFDPWNESVSYLDLWVRLPGLPTKYVSDSILTSLIEENKIGKVLRVAAFSTKGARLRYPRICISTDLSLIRERKVTMLNEYGEIERYPVWFEDFPEGCGCCGALDHLFEDCPIRRVCNATGEGILGEVPGAENNGEGESLPPGGEAWVKVAARKAPPPSFGHSKAEIWSCFGKNVVVSSDSFSSNSSSITADESTTQVEPTAQGDEVFSTPLVAQAPASTPVAAPPNDDAHLSPAEVEFLDPELYNSDDDELMEYEDEAGLVDGFSGIPADMTQADFDAMLANIPASEEFVLPPLSNPARLITNESLPSTAPLGLPNVGQKLQQLRVEETSKSESGKRKLGEEEGESASSDLMGGGSKRGKHGK